MRSDTVKKGFDRAPHRSLLRATGQINDVSDFNKPFIAVCNSYVDIIPGHAHLLTFSCFRRMPLLSKDRTRRWFLEALGAARSALEFDLWAWVIMPEHVHLLIYPRREGY